jgi:phospholipid/cholesterol/gamma-HCH transport system substrate-binding protein
VKKDTVAIVATQGLTGIAHVELTGGSANSPDLEPLADQRYPVIQTKPSLLVRLDTAVSALLSRLTEVTGQMGGVIERLNLLLADDQRKNLTDTLGNIERITGALALHTGDLDASMRSITTTLKNAEAASAKLPAFVDNANRSFAQLQSAVTAINRTTGRLDTFIAGAQQDLGRFGNSALPQVGSLLTEMRELTGGLRRLTRDLERNPNSLLFGHPKKPPGPGE